MKWMLLLSWVGPMAAIGILVATGVHSLPLAAGLGAVVGWNFTDWLRAVRGRP